MRWGCYATSRGSWSTCKPLLGAAHVSNTTWMHNVLYDCCLRTPIVWALGSWLDHRGRCEHTSQTISPYILSSSETHGPLATLEIVRCVPSFKRPLGHPVHTRFEDWELYVGRLLLWLWTFRVVSKEDVLGCLWFFSPFLTRLYK